MKRLVYILFVFVAGTAAACDPGGRWQPVGHISAEMEGDAVKYSKGGIIVAALEGQWFTNWSDLRIQVANEGVGEVRLKLKEFELLVFEPAGDIRTSSRVVSITFGDDILMGPASGRFYEKRIAEMGGEEEYLNSPQLYLWPGEARELSLRFDLPPDQVEDWRFVSVRNVTLRVPLQVGAGHTVVFEIPYENDNFDSFWHR